MNVISEAQQKGIVRTHGTSCHTLPALKAAAASPWVQVDLASMNPAQRHMDADPQTVASVLRQMKKSGKGVIGMKIFGQGDLKNRDGRMPAVRDGSRLHRLLHHRRRESGPNEGPGASHSGGKRSGLALIHKRRFKQMIQKLSLCLAVVGVAALC